MFSFTLLCSTTIVSKNSIAQDWSEVWSHAIGGEDSDFIIDLEEDDQGNVFLLGWFDEEIDFDPGAGEFVVGIPYDHGSFLLKLSSEGTFQWVRTMYGNGEVRAYDLTLGSDGGIWVTGEFGDTVNISPEAGGQEITSLWGNDGFTAHFNQFGSLVWVSTLSGFSLDRLKSIAVAEDGSSFVTGYYHQTMIVNTINGNDTIISNGTSDILVAKLDSAGQVAWIKSFGGDNDDFVQDIELSPEGQLWLTGHFHYDVDFDPSDEEFVLESQGNFDGFISRLSVEGDFIQTLVLTSSDDVLCYDLEFDSSGNIFLTGAFRNTRDFDPGIQESLVESMGFEDIFYSKYNDVGELQWVETMGGPGEDIARDIELNDDGQILVSGWFEQSVFLPYVDDSISVQSAGFSDAVFVLADEFGGPLTAYLAGGSGMDRGFASALSSESVIVAGQFEDETLPDENLTSLTLLAQDFRDAFVAKFSDRKLDLVSSLNSEIQMFEISPNPSSGMLNLEFKLDNNNGLTIDLLSAQGNKLDQYLGGKLWSSIDVSSITPGIYFIRALNRNTGDIQIEKFVKI